MSGAIAWLTEPAYTRLDHILNRFEAALSMTPEEADVLPVQMVEALNNWFRSLSPDGGDIAEFMRSQAQQNRPGWLQVYKPGSIVCRRGVQGLLHEIEILEPEIMSGEASEDVGSSRGGETHNPMGAAP